MPLHDPRRAKTEYRILYAVVKCVEHGDELLPLNDGGAAINGHGCVLTTKKYNNALDYAHYFVTYNCAIDSCIRAIKYTADKGPAGEVFYAITTYCIKPDDYLSGSTNLVERQRLYGNWDYADYDMEANVMVTSRNSVCFTSRSSDRTWCKP